MKQTRILITFIAIAMAVVFVARAAAADVKTEKLILPGLRGEVTVRTDKYGTPHIKASNNYDLFYAQGYIQAKDRLFQMDINRRRANGTMAELRGQRHVGGDFDVYRAGIPQVSQKILALLNDEEMESLQAYCDGINAYIAGLKETPAEYKQLGVVPQPWKPVDSIAVWRSIAWVMSSDLFIEIAVGVLVKTLGKSIVAPLLPIEAVDPAMIVPSDKTSSFPEELFDENVRSVMDSPLFASVRQTFGSPIGSNNWAVAKDRAANGHALISGDTHMGLPIPCEWYETHLEGPQFNVIGMALPGTPGVSLGHNGHVAWSITTARIDVTDVYVEKLDPEKPDTHYIYKGESRPFDVQEIEIKYITPEGMKSEKRKLLSTVHGPVVYETKPQSVMSFRWNGHEPTNEIRAFHGFMKSKNIADFKKALDSFEVGGMNFLAADTEGSIYYRAAVKTPIRKGTAYMPLDGSSGEYEWTGYIPTAELPHSENPSQSFLVTANNRQTGSDYPYYLGVFYDKGWRAHRIADMIKDSGPVTFDRMQKIQADVYSMPAETMLPIMLAATDKYPEYATSASVKSAIETLRAWDKFETVDSAAPSIFYKWLKHIALNIFRDDVPADALGNLGRSEIVFPMIIKKKKMLIDFFDDKTTPGTVETREQIFAKSIIDAVAELEQQLGADQSQWRWGRLHQVTLDHPLRGKYNLGPFEADGGMDTIDVADFGLFGSDFNFGHGPSQRMTFEMKPGAVRGENVIAGGQSGDLDSPHYSDMVRMWLENRTHPVLYSDSEIDAALESRIEMSPK